MPDVTPAPLGSLYVTDIDRQALEPLRAAAVSLPVLCHVSLLAPAAPARFLSTWRWSARWLAPRRGAYRSS
jgi:hypothetical protein